MYYLGVFYMIGGIQMFWVFVNYSKSVGTEQHTSLSKQVSKERKKVEGQISLMDASVLSSKAKV